MQVESFESRHGRTLAHLEGADQRDPRAATEALRWVSPGAPMVPEWDADQAIRYGYIANVIAFRCVQIVANTIAALPFRAGRDIPELAQVGDPNPGARLAQLLGPTPGGPAPQLPARKLWAWSVAQRMVTGRWAWELELADRTKGEIVNIWPLAVVNFKAIPTTSGAAWWAGFTYGRPDDPKSLTPDQCFYAWDPSLTDFRQPESAMQASRYDLSLAVMGDRHSLSFLRNGAVPATVVTTTPFPDKAARARFRRQWDAQYRGPDNAGRTAFHEATGEGGDGTGDIGRAIDVKVLGLSAKDQQFVEQHQASLERVAMGLGVPWSRLDSSGRTFDNASAEDILFWEQTILPKATTYGDEINMGLAPRLGSELGWFDLSKVRALTMKQDPVTAQVGAPTMVQSQLMWINEARADYGLPPIPGGDRMMTVEEIAALHGAGPAQVQLAPPRAAPAPPALPSPPRPVRVRTTIEHRAMTADQLEQRRARLWRSTDAALVTLESRWVAAFRRLFAKQATATLARLEGKRGRQSQTRDTGTIFDAGHWRTVTEEITADLYEAVANGAAVRLSDKFALSFTVDNERMQQFIAARSNQLAGQVTDTTYSQITDAMAAGAEVGESIPEIADRIRHVFEVADEARAVTIARTEVISAYNGTTAEFASEAGPDVVAGQEWLSTVDGRTREDHAAASGQIVPVGGTFDVGGEQLAYPGDPNGSPGQVVNCRCTTTLITPDELAEIAPDLVVARTVPVGMARAVIAIASAGAFDERIVRRALREVAAA